MSLVNIVILGSVFIAKFEQEVSPMNIYKDCAKILSIFEIEYRV